MTTLRAFLVPFAAASLIACAPSTPNAVASRTPSANPATNQVPTWSPADLQYFLHGSMSTEVVPETVLRAFVRTYPDLFPSSDLSHLGLIPDPEFGWPVGFSRAAVPHLGGLSSVGVNCASCHVAEIVPAEGGAPVRVLGATAHFDAEAYFGAVTVATFRTADPANMKRFLAEYLAETDSGAGTRAEFERAWQQQEPKIVAAIAADPSGSKGVTPGALHELTGDSVRLDRQRLGANDLAAVATSILHLFHNMRAALHIPDELPKTLPIPSGPGRNDAFGLLSAGLFAEPQPLAPVKYGLLWDLEHRPWVHWDGNTRSPIGRNLLAALGLGAPLAGKRGVLDLAAVERHTKLTERILPPRYPFATDDASAKRGATHYQARCVSCHDGPQDDTRLYAAKDVGTDPLRAELFTAPQAERFNGFLGGLEIANYKPAAELGLRSTQRYWAPNLAGVWARSPYLHNGSVRTMAELLSPPSQRASAFQRGSRVYDTQDLGFKDEGYYRLDTTIAGSSPAGHDYGTDLSAAEKRELIEYLKTL